MIWGRKVASEAACPESGSTAAGHNKGNQFCNNFAGEYPGWADGWCRPSISFLDNAECSVKH